MHHRSIHFSVLLWCGRSAAKCWITAARRKKETSYPPETESWRFWDLMVLIHPASGKCWAGFSDFVCTKKWEFRSFLGRRDEASATVSKHFHLQTLWLHSCLLVSAALHTNWSRLHQLSVIITTRILQGWKELELLLRWAFNTCWARLPRCMGSVCHTNAEGGSTSTNTTSGLRETSCYSISDTSHKAEAVLILPTRPSGCSLVTCEAWWLDRKSLIHFLFTSLFKHE